MTVYCTFNPDDKHANLTLSNGNLTVTDNGPAGFKVVRGTQSFSTGKLYWEWTVGVQVTNMQDIGWCDSVHPLNAHIGRTTTGDGWGYHGVGRLYHNNLYTSTPSSFTENDVLMFAIDLDAGKLWVGVNGTWAGGGDPAAGTGETRNDIDVTPLFPAVSTYDAGHSGTANFGASSFTYTIPSGFSGCYTGAQTALEDASLDLSVWGRDLSDLASFLRAHDGVELRDLQGALEAADWDIEDLKSFLSAYYESMNDAKTNLETWATKYTDLAGFLSAYYESMADAKTNLETWATKYNDGKVFLEAADWNIEDIRTWLSTYGQSVSCLSTRLHAGKDILKNLALFLYAASGVVLDDLGCFLYAGNGVIETDLGLSLRAVSSVPVFRSTTAQRVSSVVSEVI